MTYDPKLHHRHSIRLPQYDYSQLGAYFVTLCTANHLCLFGEIMDDRFVTSELGEIVRQEWFRTAQMRRGTLLHEDEFGLMPNHLRGILRFVPELDASSRESARARPVQILVETGARQPSERPAGPQAQSLAAIMAGFKATVARRVNLQRVTPNAPIWQRNYWEHVIRDDADLARIRQYIADNPARWALDQLNPEAKPNRFNMHRDADGGSRS